jgi:uncharacterized protein YegJ (DUF2314 family)
MKKRYLSIVIVASLGVLLATGCDMKPPTSEGKVVQRENQPDVVMVQKENPKMTAAMEKARQDVPQFLQALQHPTDTQKSFIIKLPVTDGKKVEHMWAAGVTYDGKELEGKLVDDAYEVPGYKTGQTVRIAPEKLTDWAYQDGDKPVGGYTNIVIEEMAKK